MKKLYFLLMVCLIAAPSLFSQQVWDNYEDIRKVDYGFIHGVLIPYNANPDPTGANTSQVAASYTRNSAELFDVLIMEAPLANVADYVSGTKSISLDVWSPVPNIVVQVTLEDLSISEGAPFPTGRHSVYLGTTTVTNAWETITLTFDNIPDGSISDDDVDRFVLLLNPNTNTGDTYYIDNINGPEFVTDPCDGVTPDEDILNDFECNQNLNFTFSHSGTNFRRVVNPDMSGVNTSSHTATYTRNAGEENDVIVASYDGTLTIENNSVIKMDVWDPAAPTNVTISLQFEDGTGFPLTVLDTSTLTSGSSQWETLTFPIGDAAGMDVNQIVVLFDPGNFTSGNYFFDNIKLDRDMGTAIEDLEELTSISLFPNPVSDQLNIEYTLSETSNVDLVIYDISGRQITALNEGNQPAGNYRIAQSLENFNSGLYSVQVIVNGNSTARTFSVIK